jgi:hypothetical protein
MLPGLTFADEVDWQIAHAILLRDRVHALSVGEFLSYLSNLIFGKLGGVMLSANNLEGIGMGSTFGMRPSLPFDNAGDCAESDSEIRSDLYAGLASGVSRPNYLDGLFGQFRSFVSGPTGEAFRIEARSVTISGGRSSFFESIQGVHGFVAQEEMFATLAEGGVTAVQHKVWSRITAILNGIRQTIGANGSAGKLEGTVSVATHGGGPEPTVSLGTLPWSFVDFLPKSGDVSIIKWGKWFRLVVRHVSLLNRLICLGSGGVPPSLDPIINIHYSAT